MQVEVSPLHLIRRKDMRNKLLHQMLCKGIQIGQSGKQINSTKIISLFGEYHADNLENLCVGLQELIES
ncbi:uncharacterized protein LOC143143551 [Ptiloglossa arizonensis]|uniref:uncharacterized protein LOC143143551 n=1 Tax=Ptiloglossa arizonensis TaxID=3350558 RepID=UPI003FA13FE1